MTPGGPPVWEGTAPIGASGLDYSVPTAALEPGSYLLTWTATELGDGQRVPFVLEQGAASTPIPITISGPRERVLSASVSDAPNLLRHTQLIGSPFRQAYPRTDSNDNQARAVQDLQWFEGRIFAGGGDWQKNRGPVSIWSFAPGDAEGDSWKQDGPFQEESFDRFRVLDDDGEPVLAAPGIDPQESWDFGNVYFRRRNPNQKDPDAADGWKWEKKRTIPGGVLNFDVAQWGGKLYVTGNTNKGSSLKSSLEFGQTWEGVAAWNYQARVAPYEMAALPDGVLMTQSEISQGVLWQDKTGLRPISADLIPALPGTAPRDAFYGAIRRLTTFPTADNPNGVLYAPKWGTSLPLSYLPSPTASGALLVEPFAKTMVRDIIVRDGTVLVLTGAPDAASQARMRSNDNDGRWGITWEGAVYSSKDLKTWRREAAFQTMAMPMSLETAKSAYYIGLGTQEYSPASVASGDILRLTP